MHYGQNTDIRNIVQVGHSRIIQCLLTTTPPPYSCLRFSIGHCPPPLPAQCFEIGGHGYNFVYDIICFWFGYFLVVFESNILIVWMEEARTCWKNSTKVRLWSRGSWTQFCVWHYMLWIWIFSGGIWVKKYYYVNRGSQKLLGINLLCWASTYRASKKLTFCFCFVSQEPKTIF